MNNEEINDLCRTLLWGVFYVALLVSISLPIQSYLALTHGKMNCKSEIGIDGQERCICYKTIWTEKEILNNYEPEVRA